MIYAIVYVNGDNFDVYGYFTNEKDAEKYYAVHSKENLYIKEVPCYDDKEDLSNVVLMYEYSVTFEEREDNSWELLYSRGEDMYSEKCLRDNYIDFYLRNVSRNRVIEVYINSTSEDFEVIHKMAQDILHQYLDSCNGNPSKETVIEFNKILQYEGELKR